MPHYCNDLLFKRRCRKIFFSKATIFPKENGQDTVNISFSHYPGQNTVKVPFVLSLIGPTPSEDLEYKVSVVDSLTTAITGVTNFPPSPIFRKERSK